MRDWLDATAQGWLKRFTSMLHSASDTSQG
jgi:hypothetical protein